MVGPVSTFGTVQESPFVSACHFRTDVGPAAQQAVECNLQVTQARQQFASLSREAPGRQRSFMVPTSTIEVPWEGRHRAIRQAGTMDGFYSAYFIIPNKGGGLRPILDLSRLNAHLKMLIFHMLRTADVLQGIKQGDWFTTIDLTDAYFHVPITPRQTVPSFCFEGRADQFCVLSFGISLAPRVFTSGSGRRERSRLVIRRLRFPVEVSLRQ